MSSPERVAVFLREARQGSESSLGRALEECRAYLMHIALQELHPLLHAKAGASDVVQETFIAAWKDFGQFHGETEGEWLAWLRQILLHRLWNLTRAYRNAAKRDAERETPLCGQQELAHLQTPSREAMAFEKAQLIDQAIARMPEPYRDIIRWRYQERLEFADIARKLGRSAEAVRRIWSRALARLQHELEERHE